MLCNVGIEVTRTGSVPDIMELVSSWGDRVKEILRISNCTNS